MGKPTRTGWVCPQCANKVLGPQRPRKDNVCRYCLACSAKAGKLVQRVAPLLERKRTAAADKADTRRRKRAEKERAQWLLHDGGAEPFDIWEEYLRLQRFDPFSRTDWRTWGLHLRLCRRAPGHSGWCRPSTREISLSIWPDLDRVHLCETLLHEMVHAVVKGQRDGPRWHGDKFRGQLDESARKVFDLPPELSLPTYSGPAYGLDRAICAFLRGRDPRYFARQDARRRWRRDAFAAKAGRDGAA